MNAPQPSAGSAAFRILAGAASPNSAAASQGGRLKTTASASKLPVLVRLDELRPAGRRNPRHPLPEEHLAALTAHRVDQRLGELADAAAHMGHPAARHVERGRAVECVGMRRSRLSRDQQLAVHVSAQVFRLPMQMGVERPERIRCQPRHPQRRPSRHVQTSAGQLPQLAHRLRRPGHAPQRHLPQRVGRRFLPAPEWLSRRPEGSLALRLPARRVGPAGHRRAIRQMCAKGGRCRLDGPGDAERLGQPGHPAARLESCGQGRAGVKPIPLVVERSRAAARIDVRLQHGHVQPCLRQQRGSGQPADTCADHNNSVHSLHSGFQLQASSIRLVFQPRNANSTGIPIHISAPASPQNGWRLSFASTSSTTSVVRSSTRT